MLILTDDAVLNCKHVNGIVTIVPTQDVVTIDGRKILVEPDPENKGIVGCPMYGPAIKPCTTTLKVQKGYSDFLRIQNRRICLDTVTGLTDGSPPGSVMYEVRNAGQNRVSEKP